MTQSQTIHQAYTYLEGIATADVAYRAWGRTINDLFFASAQALINVMVEDLDTIEKTERRTVELEDDQLDLALFQFLGEFVYFKDARHLLVLPEKVSISHEATDEAEKWKVQAVLAGEEIQTGRHELSVDVKAVTLHHFHLQQTRDGWEAVVVLDI